MPQKGGAFLVEELAPNELFTPEDLSAESRLMARTMEEFVRREIVPVIDRIECHEPGLIRRLLQRSGELGLLGLGIPEQYGGLNLPKSAITLITEKVSPNASFAITHGAHTGISTLPLLFFGTPEQKRQYLPGLATGETVGAFALSEANSGSDALSAQTRATLSPDGKNYVLNGAKMWTTNGGIADLITVFAQLGGAGLTAFLVERGFSGISVGREENKLGLRGSSTCRILLDDAIVPAENLLGDAGKGYRVALYPLNIGRFQIGSGAVGACKDTLHIATQYAKQRRQFGKPIAEFGLVRHKLAEIAIRIFVLESAVYRIAGCWDPLFGAIDDSAPGASGQYRDAAEEYSIECAILKFFGSETLDYVVDEGLQIHGGYGYTEEFPMARAYRDARINRIFEGTNEINRLTVMDQMMRRAQKGRIGVAQAAAALKDRILSPSLPEDVTDPLDLAGSWVRQIRDVILYCSGQAWEAMGEALAEEQELLAGISDMIAALYTLESGCLRARKLAAAGSDRASLAAAAVTVWGADMCSLVEQSARGVLAAFSSGDILRTHSVTARRLLKPPLVNTVALRRTLADALCAADGYPWN